MSIIEKNKNHYLNKLKQNMVNDNILDIYTGKSGFYYDGTVKYVHNKCGMTSISSIITIRKQKKEYCQYCYGKLAGSEEAFNLKFREKRKDSDEYCFIDKFQSLLTDIRVAHNCGYEFITKPAYLLYDNTRCPKCMKRMPSNKKELLIQKIKNADINNEYEVLDVFQKDNKFCIKSKAKLKHLSCGHIFDIIIHNFISNNRRCPVCSKHKLSLDKVHSKKSDYIENILINLGIDFEREKKFDGLKHKRKLPLDFYFKIDNKEYAIEFDGKQHFLYNDSSTIFSKEKMLQIQKRDKIKTEYCEHANIKLLRFNYLDDDEKILNTLKDIVKNSSETIENIANEKNISE